MALYDLAVGDGNQRERGAILLTLLGNPDVARYRAAWVEKSEAGPVIAIYTRQGGGNRECYCADYGREHPDPSCYAACNEALAKHPLYLRDQDDGFDATYATFYFRAPAELPASVPADLREVMAAALEALPGIAVEPVDTDQRWQDAIARIQSGDLRPAETAMADQLGAMLADPSPDAPTIMEV